MSSSRAKRRRLDPCSSTESLFTDRVDNVLLTHIMQLLDAIDVLHLSQTCKRFKSRYLAKLPDLRRCNNVSDFTMLLKGSSNGTSKLVLTASSPTSWTNGHVVEFVNRKPSKANLKISADKSVVFVTFERSKRTQKNAQRENQLTKWNCFVQEGTHLQAFILLADYVSKCFAFEELRLSRLNERTSHALSQLPFVIRGILELSGSFGEESLRNWFKVKPSPSLMITLETPINLGREVFDDSRVVLRNGFALRIRGVLYETESQVLYEHLEAWMGNVTRLELLNTESYVNYEELKKLIEKWILNEELEIEFWCFSIGLDRGIDLGSIYEDLTNSFELRGPFSRRRTFDYPQVRIADPKDISRTLTVDLRTHRQRQLETNILMVDLFEGTVPPRPAFC